MVRDFDLKTSKSGKENRPEVAVSECKEAMRMNGIEIQ